MERIWFDSTREQFFSIPDKATLEDGDLALRTVTGLRKQVDPASVAAYRISRAEATDRLGARIDEAWGGFVGAVDRVLAAGRLAARQAGVSRSEDPDEGEGSRTSPLPEHLSDWLGMEPGELLTSPDKVRERIREAAAQAGLHIKPRAESPDEGEPDRADAAAEDEDDTASAADTTLDAEEVIDEPTDEEAASSSGKAPESDPLRDLLGRPEVSEAISTFGRALSRLGARLQDASRPPRGSDDT